MAFKDDLVIDRRSRFMLVIQVNVEWLANLSGYNAFMQIRETPANDILLDDWSAFLTVGSSTVTLDLAANESLNAVWTRGHYDIVLSNGDPTMDIRVMQGTIRLDKEVTR